MKKYSKQEFINEFKQSKVLSQYSSIVDILQSDITCDEWNITFAQWLDFAFAQAKKLGRRLF